jgi:sugar lactone lactonase YvrE
MTQKSLLSDEAAINSANATIANLKAQLPKSRVTVGAFTTSSFASLNPIKQPESLCIDTAGNVYMSCRTNQPNTVAEVYMAPPSGKGAALLVTLPSPEVSGQGIIAGESALLNKIYVMSGNTGAIYRFDAVTGANLEKYSTGVAGLNDMIQDNAGNLYISKANTGEIWTIPNSGPLPRTPVLWSNDPLIATQQNVIVPTYGVFAANGLAWTNSSRTAMYVHNLGLGRIVYIPVNGDGTAGTGGLLIESELLIGSDGMDVDANGYIWSCNNIFDYITRFDPSSKIIDKVVSGYPLLDAPASIKFLPHSATDATRTAFVCNFSARRKPPAASIAPFWPGQPNPGLIKLNITFTPL